MPVVCFLLNDAVFHLYTAGDEPTALLTQKAAFNLHNVLFQVVI